MDKGKCIFQLRGVSTFLSNKFHIIKHKNYKYTLDYDEKKMFDVKNILEGRVVKNFKVTW